MKTTLRNNRSRVEGAEQLVKRNLRWYILTSLAASRRHVRSVLEGRRQAGDDTWNRWTALRPRA